MGGICGTHVRDEKCVENFTRETCREQSTWRRCEGNSELDVEGNVT